MATIKNRTAKDGTPRYTAEVRLKGYPAQTATFKRLTDAKKWVQDTESAIREGRHFKTVEAKKHTLADLVDRYIKDIFPSKPKQIKAQKRQLLWWREQLGDYALADITTASLTQCRDKLLTELNSKGVVRNPATVVRYMAALSHAYTIAVTEWQWLESNPMRNVKKPKESRGRVRYLSDSERASLFVSL